MGATDRSKVMWLGTMVTILLAWVATPGAAPAAPFLSVPVVSGSTVTLSWSVPFGTSAVRLQAGTAPGASNAADITFGAIGRYTATSVPPGVYYVRVRAVDASGQSAPSNEVVVIVGAGSGVTCSMPPGAPMLGTPVVSGTSIAFAWTEATGGCAATSFTLQFGSAAGSSDFGAFNVGRVTSAGATATSGTFYVRVVAQNAAGASAPSNTMMFVVGEARGTGTIPSGLVGGWSYGNYDSRTNLGSFQRYDFRSDGGLTYYSQDGNYGRTIETGRVTALGPDRLRLLVGTFSQECLYTLTPLELKLLCGNPPDPTRRLTELTFRRVY